MLLVVVGGAGISVAFVDGASPSDDSTLRYASRNSPMECSGTHASKYEEALKDLLEPDELGLSALGEVGFSCIKAMKPAMLSLEEGEG